MNTDTIAAQATPPGRGGVGIVRVSGARACEVALALLGKIPQPRYATYLPFLDAQHQAIDEGIALFFPAPNSFTGEDVLELQGHGGPVVMDLLLQTITQIAGVRVAKPGEFSERAFLNDKLDLAQAEAIADLIDASSVQAARSALKSLNGEFSLKIHQLVEQLIALRMYVEAAIDFPEEEIDFLSDGHVAQQLEGVQQQIQQVLAQAKQGSLLREGMTVVIAGRPNAGKSSLLNALAGKESAIVTEIAGTTRDIIREHIQIEGIPLHIVDTAGLRDSDDPIEQEGVRRAKAAMQNADRILLVIDGQQLPQLTQLKTELLQELPNTIPITVIINKIDVLNLPSKQEKQGNETYLYLSAKDGQGMDLLRQHLLASIGFEVTLEGGFIARRRHLDAIQRAQQCVEQGAIQLQQHRAGELLAEDLRQAQQALSEITGEFTPDDLLGEIFSRFCIGK